MKNKNYRDGFWLEVQYWIWDRSAPDIAEECGVTKHAIHYWMNKYGIPLRTVSEAKQGKMHPMYGRKLSVDTRKKMSDVRMGSGTMVLADGKVRHRIPDHPNVDSSGYILESRLIMEHELGRYLEPLEVVHHIDRDVSNNNLENLRLFECNGKHSTFHHNENRYAKYVTTG